MEGPAHIGLGNFSSLLSLENHEKNDILHKEIKGGGK